MTTIHVITATQKTVNGHTKNLCVMAMGLPRTSFLKPLVFAKVVGKAIPELIRKLTGMTLCVLPTMCQSCI